MQIGDIVQLANSRGDFYHSLLISGFSDGEILICAQSNDALDRPLSTYRYSVARFLHVEGVNIEISDEINSFLGLIGGASLPPKSQIYVPMPL